MIPPAGWLLLFIGAASLLLSYNALRPHYARATLATVSFFAGWIKGELALHALVIESLLLGLLVWHGALASWPGRVGGILSVTSLAMMILSLRQSLGSGLAVDAALVDFVHHEPPRAGLRWRPLLFPLPVRHPDVERLRNRIYYDGKDHNGRELRLALDVFRRRGADHGPTSRRPTLVYVHGGAWMIGSKTFQGLPMLHHFAALGWICFSINYRLSPRATFPDHVVDVKRALAWVRAHATELGADPDFIILTGNSAGGHLASLAALTADDRTLQPGFEEVDTSVAACMSFYGIYDFGDRHGHWPNRALQELLQRFVMKARLTDAPERFEAASPIARIGPHAPPFLVVHGERDSMVPVAEARAFVAALRRVTGAACAYIEVPGAQHAFEVFPSVRTLHLLRGLERFALHVRRDHERSRAQRRANEVSHQTTIPPAPASET